VNVSRKFEESMGIVKSGPLLRPVRFRDAMSARDSMAYAISSHRRTRLHAAGGRELPWFCLDRGFLRQNVDPRKLSSRLVCRKTMEHPA
jgi:hypothetical protein